MDSTGHFRVHFSASIQGESTSKVGCYENEDPGKRRPKAPKYENEDPLKQKTVEIILAR